MQSALGEPPECRHRSEKQVHILFLIDTFHGRMGGGEGNLLSITQLLPRDRYRCSVVTFASRPDLVNISSVFSCPVYVLPLQRTYGWNGLKVAMKLWHMIRSQQVQIVHTFFATSDIWGGLISKVSGCPLLVSSRRDMGILRSSKHRLGYRLLSVIVDQVQAVSEAVRNYSIREDGIDPTKVVTLHNGVNLDEVDSAPPLSRSDPRLGLSGASQLIITVGNIRPVKGIDTLVRTAAIVCRAFPTTTFLIVGEPHGREIFTQLRNLIQDLGLTENVRFLGKRPDVLSLLKACDAFCLLSRSEGLSNALLEAMACGLPCVVTNVGGNEELVEEGRSGFLVPPDEPVIAAQRLMTLVRRPELARQMGNEGRQIIEAKFTAQMMVSRLVALYDQLVEHRSLNRAT